jgi:hypothetical protein
MTDITERKFYNDLDNDAAADWTPVGSDLSDVDRAWSMATHLCKMHTRPAIDLGWQSLRARPVAKGSAIWPVSAEYMR